MEWLLFMWNIIWRTSKKHFIISPQYCPQKATKLDQIVIKTWREITLYQSSEYWWLSQFWRGLGLVTSLQKASRWSQNFTRTTDLHFQKGWLCKKKNPWFCFLQNVITFKAQSHIIFIDMWQPIEQYDKLILKIQTFQMNDFFIVLKRSRYEA